MSPLTTLLASSAPQQMHLASSFYFSDPIYSPIMPHGGIGDFLTHAIAALPHQIRLDVVETDAEFRVSAELPGVALKDVNIDVDACNVLRISAVHAERELHDDVVGGVTYHLSERTAGRQTRSLQMPGNADASRITAKLEQGVLSISVPKIAAHEARGRRRIVVNAA